MKCNKMDIKLYKIIELHSIVVFNMSILISLYPSIFLPIYLTIYLLSIYLSISTYLSILIYRSISLILLSEYLQLPGKEF